MKRTVIITGGTKGLGLEISLAFHRAGYSVVALYSSDEVAAARLRAILEAAPGGGCVLRHDVSVEDASLWQRPEIAQAESLTLIHSACAAFRPLPLHQLSWKDFELNLNVALKGAWFCSQALLRPMLKSGRGTIVNILTAALAAAPPKGFSAYVTAKHALRGLTLALAAEYADRGLRVFSASPAFMDTPLTESWDPRLREMIRAASTRITTPADAAARLLALVEDPSCAGRGEDYPL